MRPPRNRPCHVDPDPEGLKNEYLRWLYTLLFGDEEETKYWCLSNKLFSIPFYWTVPNDDNRAEDGIQYRQEFFAIHYKSYDIWWDEPCSVFEMLFGLANRMEDILENPMRPSDIGQWFEILISNIGLKACTDDFWSSNCEKLVDRKIAMVLDRTYNRYGQGGLFPLERNVKRDQRTVELWYQLMAYIDETFDI